MGSQFDTAAIGYEASAIELPLREYLESYSVRALCGDVAGKLALDLGCGTGLYTRRLARWGAEVVIGADISEGMLATARELERADPLGVEYIHRDLTGPCECEERFRHLEGRIDLVLAVYLLCYAKSVADLEAMCRISIADLKPGGVFLAPTLSPGYADEAEYPDYYRNYHFHLNARRLPASDGSTVTLSIDFPDGSATDPVRVDAVWWSTQTYERSLRRAGFRDITWHEMKPSEEGLRIHGEAFWANYLARPHAVVIEARA